MGFQFQCSDLLEITVTPPPIHPHPHPLLLTNLQTIKIKMKNYQIHHLNQVHLRTDTVSYGRRWCQM